MYNQERKERFIAENNNFTDKELYDKRARFLFSRTEESETRLAKDACDFSHNEILDYYKTLATPSLDTLVVTNNILNTYSSWCLKNKYIVDGLNHYAEMSMELLNTCVNFGQQRELFVSRADLLKAIGGFLNAYEQVVVLGLYEGLDLVDLRELTLEDVDLANCTVNLHDRVLTISKELIHYIEDSANTYERYTADEKKTALYDLDGEHVQVIKTFGKERNGKQPDRGMQLFNIMKRIKTNYGYSWLSAANLPQAGAANMLLELWQKESEKSAEEVANEHIDEFKLRYGVYWRYGKRFELKFGFVFK